MLDFITSSIKAVVSILVIALFVIGFVNAAAIVFVIVFFVSAGYVLIGLLGLLIRKNENE